jgi:hypothetical protein
VIGVGKQTGSAIDSDDGSGTIVVGAEVVAVVVLLDVVVDGAAVVVDGML